MCGSQYQCTHDCDFATKVILDFTSFDGIGSLFGDDMVQL